LNQGLRLGYPLALVDTPAGFGKTTLLSAWARECERPVAWLSVDEGDNDPLRFWAYFVAALQEIEADLGQGMSAALRSSRLPSGQPLAPWIESLLTELINDIVGGNVEPPGSKAC
jgi:LuxR family maltose regulon positive regulatory protein